MVWKANLFKTSPLSYSMNSPKWVKTLLNITIIFLILWTILDPLKRDLIFDRLFTAFILFVIGAMAGWRAYKNSQKEEEKSGLDPTQVPDGPEEHMMMGYTINEFDGD